MTSAGRIVKRAIDLVVAAGALFFLSPLILVIALLVRIYLGRPLLFRQVRPGLNARLFTIYKFRSMNDARDANGDLLPDAERVTRFGCFLRRTSLDELAQLLNVVKGDLSLVGPRPLLLQYLPLYTAEQARRHLVRPGMTGWAQVNGRNAITWEQKFRHDVWYVEHESLALDLRILAMTLRRVIGTKGIEGHGSIPFTRSRTSEDEQ